MTPQELKNSILQLAIQGRLVEQRPEEGTAEELYKKIQAEKQSLIKAGKLKKEKPLPPITDDEKPFEIPESWMWVRLGDYSQKVTDQVASGSFATLRENVPSLKTQDYAIMVKTADFSNGFSRNLTYTTKHGYDFLENSNLFGGELVLSNIGSIGKCFIVPTLNYRMTLAPNAVMVRLVFDEGRDYLYHYLLSKQGYQELIAITSGTAMKKFNKTDLKGILIALPPLAEQKRIVAKIEELLPLIDRYEKAWSRLEDFNKRFPDDMQKSILQMAIQGKLVEQRPEEGTAEDLYKQIQSEKQSLIKAGKIKKEKPLPPITDDEIPFEIPENWKWVRCSEVIDVRDGTHDTPKYVAEGVPLVTSKNLVNGKIEFETAKLISYEDATAINARSAVDNDDILFAMIGTIGNPVLVKKDRDFSIKNMALFKSINKQFVYMPYLLLFLEKEQDVMKKNANGGVQSFVSLSFLREYLFPLPPLAEQKRIVAKIEELLPLCERLK